MDWNPQLVAYIAGFLTTASFLPQAIKTIKTRDTSSLSLTMYFMFFLGVSFWAAYGVILEDKAIFIANAITLILAGPILWFKLRDTLNQSRTRNS